MYTCSASLCSRSCLVPIVAYNTMKKSTNITMIHDKTIIALKKRNYTFNPQLLYQACSFSYLLGTSSLLKFGKISFAPFQRVFNKQVEDKFNFVQTLSQTLSLIRSKREFSPFFVIAQRFSNVPMMFSQTFLSMCITSKL